MNNNYRNGEPQYKTLEEALKLAKQAVQGEKEDQIFYEYLISVAPTEEEKNIISSIRDDEMRHNMMFREIYYYFTGEELPRNTQSNFEEPKNYLAGIQKALFGELAAMERYRIIRAGLPSEYYRDMVFEILTDELKHADKYNYILSLNQMNQNRSNVTQMNLWDTNHRDQNQSNMEEDGQMVTMDELMKYIEPLVQEAMGEVKMGVELETLFPKYILMGILIGNGYPLEQSMDLVKAWKKRR